VGGGHVPRPGEISLAHRGVLFLDELPEFSPRALEVMRQPLEDRLVTISRAQGTLTFPANLQLIAAMNPCPCGWREAERRLARVHLHAGGGHPLPEAHQRPPAGHASRRHASRVDVPRVAYEKLTDKRLGESSEAIRARVEAAREVQRARFQGTDLACNADMRPAEVRKLCQLDEAGTALMRTAMSQLQLSARAFHRVLKLSRTIADLAASAAIQPAYLAEAIQYRPRRQS